MEGIQGFSCTHDFSISHCLPILDVGTVYFIMLLFISTGFQPSIRCAPPFTGEMYNTKLITRQRQKYKVSFLMVQGSDCSKIQA